MFKKGDVVRLTHSWPHLRLHAGDVGVVARDQEGPRVGVRVALFTGERHSSGVHYGFPPENLERIMK